MYGSPTIACYLPRRLWQAVETRWLLVYRYYRWQYIWAPVSSLVCTASPFEGAVKLSRPSSSSECHNSFFILLSFVMKTFFRLARSHKFFFHLLAPFDWNIGSTLRVTCPAQLLIHMDHWGRMKNVFLEQCKRIVSCCIKREYSICLYTVYRPIIQLNIGSTLVIAGFVLLQIIQLMNSRL